MSATYDPRSVTIVIDGVTLSMPQPLLADPQAEAVAEVTINPAVARMLREAILGGDFSESGRLWPYGSRGCFHAGGHPTISPTES